MMIAPALPVNLADAEGTPVWPEQGAWTYADYERLPNDGKRYEIIRGILYVANAPNYKHQYAVTKLVSKLDYHIETHNLGIVITAPFEVHLSAEARPIQPDILFIAKAKLPHPAIQFFESAPDLVVEVLSPSTRRRDQSIKLDVYEQAGVREYWIVDPETEALTIYMLPEGGREYVLKGVFRNGSTIQSVVLPQFTLTLSMIFP